MPNAKLGIWLKIPITHVNTFYVRKCLCARALCARALNRPRLINNYYFAVLRKRSKSKNIFIHNITYIYKRVLRVHINISYKINRLAAKMLKSLRIFRTHNLFSILSEWNSFYFYFFLFDAVTATERQHFKQWDTLISTEIGRIRCFLLLSRGYVEWCDSFIWLVKGEIGTIDMDHKIYAIQYTVYTI